MYKEPLCLMIEKDNHETIRKNQIVHLTHSHKPTYTHKTSKYADVNKLYLISRAPSISLNTFSSIVLQCLLCPALLYIPYICMPGIINKYFIILHKGRAWYSTLYMVAIKLA